VGIHSARDDANHHSSGEIHHRPVTTSRVAASTLGGMRNVTRTVALLSAILLSFTLQATTSIRSVAFTTDRAGGILVEARVNGAGPFRFLVDTGSARTVVSASLRERMDAPLVARSRMVSAGAEEWATVARLGSLSIGVANVADVDAIVLDDRRLRHAAGPVDGIAGQDFLGRFNYLIDRERKVLLWNPAANERPEAGFPLRLVASEGRVLVELPQARGERLMMVPDTGADTLVLFTTAASSLLRMRPVGGAVRLASLTSTRDVRQVRVARLTIGDEIVRNEPAIVVAAADAGSDGLLPLRAYRLVMFDNGRKTITLWR
jgi:predicted aspartyl protease